MCHTRRSTGRLFCTNSSVWYGKSEQDVIHCFLNIELGKESWFIEKDWVGKVADNIA